MSFVEVVGQIVLALPVKIEEPGRSVRITQEKGELICDPEAEHAALGKRSETFSCCVSFLISIQAAKTMQRLGGDRAACFVAGVPAGRGGRVPRGFPAPPRYPQQVYEQLSWPKASWEPALQPSPWGTNLRLCAQLHWTAQSSFLNPTIPAKVERSTPFQSGFSWSLFL